MTTEFRERLVNEPKTIGILGPIGSGKTTLSKILSERLDVQSVEENFLQNPFLENFYDAPAEYRFRSQLWFLKSTIDQLSALTTNTSRVLDPTNEMNYLFAKTHLDMGWMSQHEFNLYTEIYSIFEEKGHIKKPDLYIILHTDMDVLVPRIRARARPSEMLMLDNYPIYLLKLSRNINAFMAGNTISIDTSSPKSLDDIHVDGIIEKIKRNI